MAEQLTDKTHSLFDFGGLASDYDSWYDTAVGQMYDEVEKSAVLKVLPPAQPGGRLLEVGCGTGHWSRFFASLGFGVVGIDISPEMIEVARARDLVHCRFEVADACQLPLDDASFEVVAAVATLEFVSDIEGAVEEMFRCVKPDGSVIVGTLNRLAPINRDRVRGGKEPYASAHLLSPAELRALLAPYGRVRMHLSVEELKHHWARPLKAIRERFLLRWGKPESAFIVAGVRP